LSQGVLVGAEIRLRVAEPNEKIRQRMWREKETKRKPEGLGCAKGIEEKNGSPG
jgi:hypothetical protein